MFDPLLIGPNITAISCTSILSGFRQSPAIYWAHQNHLRSPARSEHVVRGFCFFVLIAHGHTPAMLESVY